MHAYLEIHTHKKKNPHTHSKSVDLVKRKKAYKNSFTNYKSPNSYIKKLDNIKNQNFVLNL